MGFNLVFVKKLEKKYKFQNSKYTILKYIFYRNSNIIYWLEYRFLTYKSYVHISRLWYK